MGNFPSAPNTFNGGSLNQPVQGVFAHFPGIYDTPATSSTSSSTTSSPEDNKTPWWVWLIVVLVGIGFAAAVVASQR